MDSLSRAGLDNKFPGGVPLFFRGESIQVLSLTGKMVRGGDGAFGGVIRIDTLDLPQVAIIGQIEDQDNCTDEDYQGPHPTTFGQIAVLTRGEARYRSNRTDAKHNYRN